MIILVAEACAPLTLIPAGCHCRHQLSFHGNILNFLFTYAYLYATTICSYSVGYSCLGFGGACKQLILTQTVTVKNHY